jgi:hypothetical protein
MKITEEVRAMAHQGMADKAAEFVGGGQRMYANADD